MMCKKILKKAYIKILIACISCIVLCLISTYFTKNSVNLIFGAVIIAVFGFNALFIALDEKAGKFECVFAKCKQANEKLVSSKAVFSFQVDEGGDLLYLKGKKGEYFPGVQYCLVFRNAQGRYDENSFFGKDLVWKEPKYSDEDYSQAE